MTSLDIMASIKKIERLAQNMADAYLASDADEIVEILNDIDATIEELGIEYGRPEPAVNSNMRERHFQCSECSRPLSESKDKIARYVNFVLCEECAEFDARRRMVG